MGRLECSRWGHHAGGAGSTVECGGARGVERDDLFGVAGAIKVEAAVGGGEVEGVHAGDARIDSVAVDCGVPHFFGGFRHGGNGVDVVRDYGLDDLLGDLL